MNKSKLTLIGFIMGAFVVAAVSHYATLFYSDKAISAGGQGNAAGEREPLHWVAPMDPNYKRDKPGKSPMGMDLIPVYADAVGGSETGPGTIRISPEVVNNLGVRTAKAVRKPLHSMIRTVGYIQYDEDHLVHIHPRVKGWIEKLYVKASGDPVSEGQALYELYSPELVNAQEELLLALKRNNERLIRAAEDRLKALQLSEDIVSDLKKSRKVNQTITFYAPQAGVVDNLKIREGFFVQPGTTLMSIGSLDDVWVEAEVFERQATLVSVDMPVTMALEYLPGREWLGKVDYVYPALDEKTRTLRVRLRFNNSDGLLQPNMFAQVVLHADSDTDSIIVPREAVIRTGNQNRVVLALGEGRFKSIAVKLGRTDEKSAEVLDGLSVGETVVTSAQFLLDSESSKTSDFRRMEAPEDDKPTSVWTLVSITGVMLDHRMVTVSHEAIPEWDWPSMTMDFVVSEDVPIEKMGIDMTMHVELSELSDSRYSITDITIGDENSSSEVAKKAVQSASAEGVINSIDAKSRIINISRAAIEKWNRPAATVDFVLAEELDIDSLKSGQSIAFLFEVRDGDFVIIKKFPMRLDENNPHAGH